MKLFADMHIHSCLSPCGDDDMTPYNIVNMALLKGLDIIAVTDHNTCGNLPAVFQAARECGMTVVPGMELETQEEVHILAYFSGLDHAMAFSDCVSAMIPDIKNRPEFFGRQLIMDADDNITGTIDRLLISSLPVSTEEASALIRSFNGVPVPAHIDRPSHGMVPILGFINPKLEYNCVEVSKTGFGSFAEFDPRLKTLTSSDAHNLGDIFEQVFTLDLHEKSAEAFIAMLTES